MPKFVLGFNIFDCRSLELQEGMVTADIFLIVECCGQRWESEIKEEQANQFIVWNEKKIWSDVNLLEEEFRTAYIEFGVYTRNWFSRNYCVGKANLQLKSVNDRLNHVYAKKSVPLTKEGMTEAAGVMTMTVYCLRENEPPPNDSQMETDETNNPENDDLTTAVCGEKIETGDGRPHMVYIDIFKVEKLPDLGWGSFPSPFVTVEFAGNMVRTDTAPNVERYNFNTQCRLPVMTPVYEDTILIKLWNKKLMGADELLAQGMVSFSELRNKPLPPRWFQLYGYDANEITDEQVKEIARQGESMLPNCFKGMLLIGGRVECFDTPDQLQAANKGPSKSSGEPSQSQRTLLMDVYEVCGAIGRESQVEISVAKQQMSTGWCTTTWSEAEEEDFEEDEEEEADGVDEINDESTSFKFKPEVGRIEAMTVPIPDDRDSRPLILINIYTRGVLSAKQRIAWRTLNIQEVTSYEAGNPKRPAFFALQPMPYNTDQKTPASVLMCLEQSPSETVQRHNRKFVRPQPYIVRAYVFMAREIRGPLPQSFGIRVSCAGTSKMTIMTKPEVRPMWMEAVDMKITLNSDHKDEPPTMEPLTVTLVNGTAGDLDVGKSVVAYEYLRVKDSMGNWEAFQLAPQWIELDGGAYGTIAAAEVLIAFELLPKSARKILAPRAMWPVDESEFNPLEHFAMLRRATLHFSLLGLRDIVAESSNPLTAAGVPIPEVEVLVKKCQSIPASSKVPRYYSMKFKFCDVVAGGNKKNKEDLLHSWLTNSLGRTGCMNFEFFQSNMVNIKLPACMILEPFITIKVKMRWRVPSPFGGETEIAEILVGDHRRSLNNLFPCCWYKGVNKFADFPFGAQGEAHQHCKSEEGTVIENGMKGGEIEVEAKKAFVEESAGARKQRLALDRQKLFEEAMTNPKAGVKKSAEIQTDTGPDGLPPEFHDYDDKTNPVGLGVINGERDRLKICSKFCFAAWDGLNYETGTMFSPRLGEKTKASKEGGGNAMIMGNFENKKLNPKCDFHYRSQPLLRDHDVIDPEDSMVDWNFEYNECYGFVKCVYKLTDGWEAKPTMVVDDEEPSTDIDIDQGAIGWIQNAFSQVGVNVGDEATDAAATAKLATAGDEEVEEADPMLDAVHVKFMDEKLFILTNESLETSKFDFLRNHAQELHEHLKLGVPTLEAPPVKNEKKLRQWLAHVQDRLLAPLKHSPAQKEIDKLATRIEDALEAVRRLGQKGVWGETIRDPLNELLARIQPDQEEPIDHEDITKTGVRERMRTIRHEFQEEGRAEFLKITREVNKRLKNINFLATTFAFPAVINVWGFDDRKFFDHWREETPPRLRVRLYFVRAICIFGKAYGSADPYIKFSVGTEESSLRNDPQWGTNEPEFYRAEERDMELPGHSKLRIDLNDIGDVADAVGSALGKQDYFDANIGSSILDLEDRWHSQELQKATRGAGTQVPKESRPLWTVDKSGKATVTGSFMLWIEMINSTEAADRKATPLFKPPATEIELRFVIWSCANCKLVDNGKIDVRVGVTLQCEEYGGPYPAAQKTDTHHGSLGEAVFEWRMVYPKIVLPSKSCIVALVLYDYNLVAGDTPVGSISLDIKKFIEKVGSSMDSMTKSSVLFFKSPADEDEGVNIGEVKLDMYVLPQPEAIAKPAGIERSEPNENPQLMTPKEGRGWDSLLAGFAFSLPSFGLWKKFLPLILFTLLALVGLKYVGLL